MRTGCGHEGLRRSGGEAVRRPSLPCPAPVGIQLTFFQKNQAPRHRHVLAILRGVRRRPHRHTCPPRQAGAKGRTCGLQDIPTSSATPIVTILTAQDPCGGTSWPPLRARSTYSLRDHRHRGQRHRRARTRRRQGRYQVEDVQEFDQGRRPRGAHGASRIGSCSRGDASGQRRRTVSTRMASASTTLATMPTSVRVRITWLRLAVAGRSWRVLVSYTAFACTARRQGRARRRACSA